MAKIIDRAKPWKLHENNQIITFQSLQMIRDRQWK